MLEGSILVAHLGERHLAECIAVPKANQMLSPGWAERRIICSQTIVAASRWFHQETLLPSLAPWPPPSPLEPQGQSQVTFTGLNLASRHV